jgi:SAM-dependent methyltransferase
MGRLADLERNWNIYGRADPLWAVLMAPDKKGGRWDLAEFFAAGESEVRVVLGHLEGLGATVDFSGHALDFGCGVGRLAQALCGYFDTVVGIDISSSMVERARELNRYPDRCHYLVNADERILGFGSDTFAFIYTSIVLQHMEPRLSLGYIAELARLLRPGGTLVFQVPDRINHGRRRREQLLVAAHRLRRAAALRTRTMKVLRRAGVVRRAPELFEAAVEMHCVPEDLVGRTLSAAGLDLLDVQLTNSTDADFAGDLRYLHSEPAMGYVSKQYCAVKPVRPK